MIQTFYPKDKKRDLSFATMPALSKKIKWPALRLIRCFGWCLILITSSVSLPAQQENEDEGDIFLPVYPIRENHKWGYYSLIGDKFYEEIPPHYDLISENQLTWNYPNKSNQPSPYRLFEKDGKVGLLDTLLNEKIPNQYNRIKPLTETYFAVEVDSLFTLLKNEGEEYTILWPGRSYHNIVYAGASNTAGKPYFLIKQAEKWGVADEDGNIVITPKYEDVKSAEYPGFFMAQKRGPVVEKNKLEIFGNLGEVERPWGLITPEDTLILDYQYRHIVALDGNTFVALHQDTNVTRFWRVFVDLGGDFKEPEIDAQTAAQIESIEGFLPPPVVNKYKYYEQCTNFQKLNRRLALFRMEKIGDFLYDIKKDERIYLKKNYKTFRPINEKYIAAISKNGTMSVLDTAFQEVIAPGNYAEIIPSGIPGKFRAKKTGKWGIITIVGTGQVEVDFQYDRIDRFVDGIARCWVDPAWGGEVAGYGAISYKEGNFDLINCQFDTIYIGAQSVTTSNFREQKEIIWQVKENGAFEMKRELDDVQSDQFSRFAGLKEATGQIVRPSRIITFPKYVKAPVASFMMKSKGNKGLVILSSRAPFDTTTYVAVLNMGDSLVALYHLYKSLSNQFSEHILRQELSQAWVFDAKTDQRTSMEPIIGFRRRSANQKLTAFIDTLGRMGLMDQIGHEKTNKAGSPLRYTYIGPFQNGYARVCTGGILTQKHAADDAVIDRSPFRIATLNGFVTDFNLKIPAEKQKDFSGLRGIGIYALPNGNDIPRWGFINTEGEEVVPPKYEFVSNFSEREGVAYTLRVIEDETLDEGTKSLENIYYGLLNSRCQTMVDMDYRNIGKFGPYFVLERDATPVFFYDNKGRQILINPTKPRPFSEGFAHYHNEEDLWGFVDTLGNPLGPPMFKRVRPFADGMAAVVLQSDTCAFINQEGRIAIVTDIHGAKFDHFLRDFSFNRCPIRKGNKWGYLDKNGQEVIPCQYLEASRFSQGVATIKDLIKGKAFYAVIDTNATEFVVNPGVYSYIKPFSDQGFAHVRDKYKMWGIINTKGIEIIKPQYAAIRDDEFLNGYVRVQGQNELWGLVNRSGLKVLEPKYVVIDTVFEGMVAVKERAYDKFQIYDIKNKRFLHGKYEEVAKFKKGVSLVRENRALKIIDHKGKEIVPKNGNPLFYSEGLFGMATDSLQYYSDPYGDNLFIESYSNIGQHKNGVAKIQISKKVFQALNGRGIVIVPPKYPRLFVDKNGFVRANPNRFYGLMDPNGKIVAPIAYDRIIAFKEKSGQYSGLFRVELGEKVGYIKIKNGQHKVIRALEN